MCSGKLFLSDMAHRSTSARTMGRSLLPSAVREWLGRLNVKTLYITNRAQPVGERLLRKLQWKTAVMSA